MKNFRNRFRCLTLTIDLICLQAVLIGNNMNNGTRQRPRMMGIALYAVCIILVFVIDAAMAASRAQSAGYFPFPFFGGGGFGFPQQHYGQPGLEGPVPRKVHPPPTSINAPPSQKPDTPPQKIGVVIGDTMADWLAYGLEQTLSESPELGVVRKVRASASLIEACKPEFRQWLSESIAQQKLAFIAIMIGMSDRHAIADCPLEAKPGTGRDQHFEAVKPLNREFHSPQWAETYSKRVDDMIATLKESRVPVFWVGLPPTRAGKPEDIGFLNDIYRERAERADIKYLDVWDGFVDESGDYAARGPDVDGQIRLLRSADGIHFTKAGARKLAHYLEREVRGVFQPQAPPLPGPEAAPGNRDDRPVAGPVVPLFAAEEAHGELSGELLGGHAGHSPRELDALASRVLLHGQAQSAPKGRADDFSWAHRTHESSVGDKKPTQKAPSPQAASKSGHKPH